MRLKAKAEFFSILDGRLVSSTNPGWILSVFYTLMGLLDRLGLHKNVRKTVGMVC